VVVYDVIGCFGWEVDLVGLFYVVLVDLLVCGYFVCVGVE